MPNDLKQTDSASADWLRRMVGLLGVVVMSRKEYDRQIMLAGLNGIEAERRIRTMETSALRRTIQKLEGKQPNDKSCGASDASAATTC